MSLQSKKRIQSKLSALHIISLSLLLIAPVIFLSKNNVEAASLVQGYVRLDRLGTVTPTGGLVCARPGTSSAVNVDVQVTFPTVGGTNFAVSSTGSNWTAVTSDIPSGTSAWPGITGATPTVSGQVVTWTYSGSQTLNTGTTYCFRWANTAALTTSATGNNLVGNIKTRTTAAATIDTADYALSIITNDQIVVTAVVPATFSFSLSANADTFTSNLSTSITSTNGRTATISTNAASGWVAWVRSANAALSSSATGASIATAGTVNDTPEDLDSVTGYVLDVDITTDSGTGTGVVQQNPGYGDEYAGADATEGGSLSTTFQPIAEATGTTAGDVLTLTERAKITAVQAAANDYTDTLTVVAAGRF